MLQFILKNMSRTCNNNNNSIYLCFHLQCTKQILRALRWASNLSRGISMHLVHLRFRFSCRCLLLVLDQVSHIMSSLLCVNASISYYNKYSNTLILPNGAAPLSLRSNSIESQTSDIRFRQSIAIGFLSWSMQQNQETNHHRTIVAL